MTNDSEFTYEYSQPSAYRFSLDSVYLAKKVAKLYRTKNIEWDKLKVLDLCSGCGVIGFEFLFFSPECRALDFIEVQASYLPHFKANQKGILPLLQKKSLESEFHLMNFLQFSKKHPDKRYGLILCNPPYFFQGEGILSPSEFKNRCRFFLDASFQELIQFIVNHLDENGEAYILVRPGSHHGKNILNLSHQYLQQDTLHGGLFSCDIVDNVRGTDVLCISHKAPII